MWDVVNYCKWNLNLDQNSMIINFDKILKRIKKYKKRGFNFIFPYTLDRNIKLDPKRVKALSYGLYKSTLDE